MKPTYTESIIFFKFRLIVVFLIVSFQASATLPDSLKPKFEHFINILNSELDNQTVRDTSYNLQVWDWKQVDEHNRNRVVSRVNERIDQSKSMADKAAMHDILRHIYQYSDLLGKAVVQYEKLIAIHSVENDSADVIRYYNWLGQMYLHADLYEESIMSMQQLVDYQKEMPVTFSYVSNIWTLGYYYSVAGWELKKPHYQDSAVKYMGQAFEYGKSLGSRVHVEWTITYAMGLARQGNKRKAIQIGTYGLRSAEINNDILYMARFHKQLSQYYLSLDMKDSAFYHIYQSALCEDQMHPPNHPDVVELEGNRGRLHLYNLGFLLEIYNKFGEGEKTVKLLDRLLDGQDKIKDPSTLMYYTKFGADVYQKNGNYKKSAQLYQQYIAYTDSIFRSKLNKAKEVKAAQLESQINIEQEKAAKEKKQLDMLAKKEKENLRTIIYSTVAVVFVTAIFLFIVYRRFKVTAKQKKVIEDQKSMVETAYNELDIKNKEILDSINYARRIQSAILPPQNVIDKHLPDSFILYLPKDIVAGDFYWLETKEGKTLIAAADCTGHGVPGAMVSVVCVNGLNRSVREHGITDPGKILDKTRDIVMDEFEKSEEEVNDGMDIALVSLETKTAISYSLKFAGAHNPLWIIRKGSNEIEAYKANRQPIGKYFHQVPFETQSLEINKGDLLYIFTDGFADQFGGPKRKKYYAANFQKFLLKIKDLPLEEQKAALYKEFNDWKGDLDQLDDICVIGVKI